MSYQPELKPLTQRLREQLARASIPGRLFIDENGMREVISALEENAASESALVIALFGEGHTAGKQWSDIIARVVELNQANHQTIGQ